VPHPQAPEAALPLWTSWGQTLGANRLKQMRFGRQFTLEWSRSGLVNPNDPALHQKGPGYDEYLNYRWRLTLTPVKAR